MATTGARGKRIADAILRIEQACVRLSGGNPLDLPTRSRHGAEHLLIAQLERLADFLEEAVPSVTSEYDTLTNKQLIDLIEARGLDKGKSRSKSELLAVLNTAEKVVAHA